jgi:Tfp pilus assembly protein PilE
MIVATVLGILASIALANFSGVREKAFIATVKPDLKNISYAQELYFINNYTYAQAAPLLAEYSPSPDVVLIMVASKEGWTAKGTHKANSDYTCAVFSGTVTMNFAPSTTDGAIECVPKVGGGLGGGGGDQGGGGGRGGGPGGAP